MFQGIVEGGSGGAGGNRTRYLFNAIEALSQMSYSPTGPLALSREWASILANVPRELQPQTRVRKRCDQPETRLRRLVM